MQRLLLPFSLLVVLFASGCSVKTSIHANSELDPQQRERIVELERLFQGLGGVNANEAKMLAQDSITYAYRLSEKYDLVWPPLWHNTLVNIGLKDRGLCYQWADDMLAHVRKGNYRSFDFYLGVSGLGTFREHNTLVVSAKGKPFDQGVVLDPWRDSGELYFVNVGKDKGYRWQLRNE